jgi:antitoxin component YwqK of YwqJK toxin-antitoxin module
MKFIYRLFLVTVFALTVIRCDSSEKKKRDDAFTFLERNAYTVNNYNGLEYYRLNETKEFMDGYYVVGNKMTKWEEFDVEKGILNGDYILFHPNGEISSHTKYLNGKRHGEELRFTSDGILTKKSTYEKDILVGKQYSYFDSGKIQSESKIEDGKPVETLTYNLLGHIVGQSFIKDGRTVNQKIEGGKVYSEMVSSNYDAYETMKFFNADGSTKLYLRMLEEKGKTYIVELDDNGNEIERVDVKANPQEAMKYFNLMNN